MKKLVVVLLAISSVGAIAGECQAVSFVVYSASCKNTTAYVYVRGDRENSVLELDTVKNEPDGSVKCYFSGNYSLTVIENKTLKREYRLYGCN